MFLWDLGSPLGWAAAWHSGCLVGVQTSGGCDFQDPEGRTHMGTVLIVLLVLVLIGALPTWPYSSGWGYYPSGGLGLVLLILLILALTGRL